MQLTTSLIRLGATPRDKNEAIRQVAALLAENGKVAPEYVEGMFAREAQENTDLGNGVAIPHGTPQSRHLIKETAIAVLQVPGGIDWEDGEGEPAYLIVGIAASDNEHLAVLKRLSTAPCRTLPGARALHRRPPPAVNSSSASRPARPASPTPTWRRKRWKKARKCLAMKSKSKRRAASARITCSPPKTSPAPM